MAFIHSPKIVTDGLVLALDAANIKSYPKTGTAWNDLCGNNIIGTLTNGPTFSGDRAGTIVFDGADDFILTNYTPTVGTGNLTYVCWFKTSVSQTTGLIGFRAASPSFIQSVLVMSATNLYMSSFDGVTNREVATTSTWADGRWHCAVMVHTSTSDTVYVDGVYQTQITSAAQNITNIQPLLIGGLANSNQLLSGWGFNGSIAIAQVYNKSLSATEVLQTFNATRGRFGV